MENIISSKPQRMPMYRRVKINEDTEDRLLDDLKRLRSSPGLMLERLTVTNCIVPDTLFNSSLSIESTMEELQKLSTDSSSKEPPLFFVREQMQIVFELQRKAKSIRFMLEKSHNRYDFLYYGTILYFHENGKDVIAAYAGDGSSEMKIFHFQALTLPELCQQMKKF